MVKKRFYILILCVCACVSMRGQVVAPVDNGVYDLIDELVSYHVIDANPAIKPYIQKFFCSCFLYDIWYPHTSKTTNVKIFKTQYVIKVFIIFRLCYYRIKYPKNHIFFAYYYIAMSKSSFSRQFLSSSKQISVLYYCLSILKCY